MTDITRRKLFIGIGSYALLSQLALPKYASALNAVKPVSAEDLIAEAEWRSNEGSNVLLTRVHRFVLKDPDRLPTLFNHMPDGFGLYVTEARARLLSSKWVNMVSEQAHQQLIDMIHHLAEYYDEVI